MAFEQKNFAPVGGQNSNTPAIYSYSSSDAVAQVEAADYFIAKQFQLSVGDEIYAYCSDGAASLVYNGVGLACTVLAVTGSGGMPSAPDDGNYHIGQSTTWFRADTTLTSDREVIARGSDFTDQNPTGTDNPLQLTFGDGTYPTDIPGGPSDPVQINTSTGAITINETGNYHFRLSAQYGRSGSGGTGWLWLRVLVNGTQAGVSVLGKLNDANSDFPYQAELTANLPATAVVTVEIWRGSEGTDAGGLITSTPVLSGANANPSADVIISQYKVIPA